uniref:C2 domain-containing protein n=1 Tax=Timema tahoe TaxID=61484 RepID=A0A7R9NWG3_9NEOP|nr:unnamed protein product [Timema tahoe]
MMRLTGVRCSDNKPCSYHKAKELPAKDLSGTSDPYVRVTLLPDKKHRLETKIKRRTLNPRWNETFYFEGFPIQKLQSRVLHLHVFDYDRFSRDDSIGEVFLPLCQVDLSEKPSFWKALKPPAKDKCGELLTSLCYHPSNSVLTLTCLKARNLKAKDINGKSGKLVWLQFGDKRIEKRKTPIFKCTLNPVFNETFSFNVPWEKIRECSLDVMVMDFDNIGRNELIGRILLAECIIARSDKFSLNFSKLRESVKGLLKKCMKREYNKRYKNVMVFMSGTLFFVVSPRGTLNVKITNTTGETAHAQRNVSQ